MNQDWIYPKDIKKKALVKECKKSYNKCLTTVMSTHRNQGYTTNKLILLCSKQYRQCIS